MSEPKRPWEELYREAEAAVDAAFKTTDDLAGWSGSSGHWGLQECNERLFAAQLAFKKTRDESIRDRTWGPPPAPPSTALADENTCLKQELASAKLGWQQGDPRHVIYKRAHIIILRPSGALGTGAVETKNGWSITTSFDDPHVIGESGTWPDDWWWTRSPADPWLGK